LCHPPYGSLFATWRHRTSGRLGKAIMLHQGSSLEARQLSSGSGTEKFLSALWQHEIERINDHLPKVTRTLEELLRMEKPELPARGGGHYHFDREDLEFLAREVPKEYHGQIRLPIILTRRLDLGKGIFSISGGRIEQSIVRWLLEDGSERKFELHDGREEPYFVYRPQVGVLLSSLRTIFAVGFT